MILASFLAQSFRQILIYFFSFMYQGHMGFIAISESIHFCLWKTIFTFPEIFCKSWDSEANLEKLSSDPSLSPTRAQTLAKIIFKWVKIVSITKFLEFALLNNHYKTWKNEESQNFKLSKLPKTAWFLQKLALHA